MDVEEHNNIQEDIHNKITIEVSPILSHHGTNIIYNTKVGDCLLVKINDRSQHALKLLQKLKVKFNTDISKLTVEVIKVDRIDEKRIVIYVKIDDHYVGKIYEEDSVRLVEASGIKLDNYNTSTGEQISNRGLLTIIVVGGAIIGISVLLLTSTLLLS